MTRDRKPNRLPGYDYSTPGAYFVTICTLGMLEHLGDIRDGRMQLNDFGKIVETQWHWAFDHFDGIETDAYMVMPNHVHGIVVNTDPTIALPDATPPTPAYLPPTVPQPPAAQHVVQNHQRVQNHVVETHPHRRMHESPVAAIVP